MTNGMRWTQEQVDAHQANTRKHKGPWAKAFEEAGRQLLESATPATKKRSKYGNKKTIANGKVFDSGLEARRYTELELMQKAGQIRNLQRQVPYDIIINGEHICTYIADFVYEQHAQVGHIWRQQIEDTKSPPTRRKPDYVLKRKLMKACHDIEIREVMA